MKELVDIFKNLRTHLMNGVSYMIPVVVGGGILMAIAVLITGKGAAPGWGDGIPYWLWTIGADALGLMVPVLSAYIAYSCLLYTSPSPRDLSTSRMPSSA